jgi:hypothetical protein
MGERKNWVNITHFQGEHSYALDSTQEWSPSFTTKLNDIITNKNNFIDITLYALVKDSPKDLLLVCSLDSRGKNIHWGATPFDTFQPKKDEWVKIHHTLKLADSYLNYPDITLSVYVWNKGRKDLFIDKFEVRTRKGNPIVYGLIEKI